MKLKTIRIAIIVLALLVGGTIFLVTSIKQKAEYNAPRVRLETVTADELREGMFVEGEIYELWSEFAYKEEYRTTLGVKHDQKTTDRYYLMPMVYSYFEENPKFIAVCTRNSNESSTFDRIIQETIDYYNNDKEPTTTIHFVGKVQALKGEALGFFRESVSECYGVSESEAERLYTPYVIRSWKEDTSTPGIVIGAVMTALGLAGAVIFVVQIIKARRGY
ncbi:MAG: DUF6709 family protein [Oscillospiraceae bacterium]